MKIAIVGLGYVGLPLSLQFTRSGVSVLGLDIDPAKVASLNQGKSYIKHIESSAIAEAVKAGYKFPSGFWYVLPNGQRGEQILCRPFKLISVALTPFPNISGVESLANSQGAACAAAAPDDDAPSLRKALAKEAKATAEAKAKGKKKASNKGNGTKLDVIDESHRPDDKKDPDDIFV